MNIIDSESVESAVRVFVTSVLLLLRSVRDPRRIFCVSWDRRVRRVGKNKKQRSRNRCAGVSLYRAMDRSAWITTGKRPVACGGRCTRTLSIPVKEPTERSCELLDLVSYVRSRGHTTST